MRTLLLAPPSSGLLLFRRCSLLFLHRPLLTFCFQAVRLSLLHRPFPAFCFQAVLLSLFAPLTSGVLLFRRCSHFSLHRSLPASCFSGGAHFSSCTAHFRRSAFWAVRTLLFAPPSSGLLLFRRCSYLFLHRSLLAFCFSGGAHFSSCTAHF